jgi:ParB family chromosome partitioning protein
MATKKPKGLGRGLEALLGPTAAPAADNGSGGDGRTGFASAAPTRPR